MEGRFTACALSWGRNGEHLLGGVVAAAWLPLTLLHFWLGWRSFPVSCTVHQSQVTCWTAM